MNAHRAGLEGNVLNQWVWESKQFHCVFRDEMEHLLIRAGFEGLTVYGDIFKQDSNNNGSEKILVAKRRDRE